MYLRLSVTHKALELLPISFSPSRQCLWTDWPKVFNCGFAKVLLKMRVISKYQGYFVGHSEKKL